MQSGIHNVKEFYKDKFAVAGNYDFSGTMLNFLDICYFKYVWMFSNIRDHSKVLDFGCGPGTLACLKRKGCEITGLDLSPAALEIARSSNHYDHVFCSDIFDFEHEKQYFDYVVSLDVFGHIPFHQKDATIAKLKDFLKPGGVMLHGIECGKIDYERLSPTERESFIAVDGHVGIEDKKAIRDRFQKIFRFVEAEVRFDTLNSAEIYQKLSNAYHEDINQDFMEFVKLLDAHEKRVFNIANGMAMIRQENLGIPSLDHSGGFLFLQASDQELVKNNMEMVEYADHADLMANPNVFYKGWYPEEMVGKEGKFRLSGTRAYLKFRNLKGKTIAFTIFSLYSLLTKWKVINVFIVDWQAKKLLRNERLHFFRKSRNVEITLESNYCILEIFCDTSFIPRYLVTDNPDERTFGIALRALRIVE